jgi:periplasmic copper chaperone A
MSCPATVTARENAMSRSSVRRTTSLLAPVFVLALVVAACGGGSGGIKVSDPWARTSPSEASAGAAYMVIENTGSAADALIGASSTVAKSTEVHETVAMPAESAAPMGSPKASDGMGGMESPAASGGMGSGGMLGMRPVDRVEIPAGGKLELKPGSYHIMLIGLNQELKVGDKIEITLKLEKAGDVKVTAEVRKG